MNPYETILFDGRSLIYRASSFYHNGIVPATMEISDELPRPTLPTDKIYAQLQSRQSDTSAYPELFLKLVARDAHLCNNERFSELSFFNRNDGKSIVEPHYRSMKIEEFKTEIMEPHGELLLHVHETFTWRKALMYRLVHERLMRSLVWKNNKLSKVAQSASNLWPLLLVDDEKFERTVHQAIEKLYRAIVVHKSLSDEEANVWLTLYDAYVIERNL